MEIYSVALHEIGLAKYYGNRSRCARRNKMEIQVVEFSRNDLATLDEIQEISN
jgi:hypothetical protein